MFFKSPGSRALAILVLVIVGNLIVIYLVNAAISADPQEATKGILSSQWPAWIQALGTFDAITAAFLLQYYKDAKATQEVEQFNMLNQRLHAGREIEQTDSDILFKLRELHKKLRFFAERISVPNPAMKECTVKVPGALLPLTNYVSFHDVPAYHRHHEIAGLWTGECFKTIVNLSVALEDTKSHMEEFSRLVREYANDPTENGLTALRQITESSINAVSLAIRKAEHVIVSLKAIRRLD